MLKMVEAKRIIGIVTVGVSCLSVIFAIVALAWANWVVDDTLSISTGLWQGCTDGICISYPASAEYLLAVRAMVLLGMFAMVGATAVTGVNVFCAKDNRQVMCASIWVAAVAGLFLSIGWIIFRVASNISQDSIFGPGFQLCVVAGLLAWIVAILNVCVVAGLLARIVAILNGIAGRTAYNSI